MTLRVAINGFGRIGRHFYRVAVASGADLEVVAANEIGSAAISATLLAYDSTHGRLGLPVEVTPTGLSRLIQPLTSTRVERRCSRCLERAGRSGASASRTTCICGSSFNSNPRFRRRASRARLPEFAELRRSGLVPRKSRPAET